MAKISLYSLTLIFMGLLSLSSARPIGNHAKGMNSKDGLEVEDNDTPGDYSGGQTRNKWTYKPSSISSDNVAPTLPNHSVAPNVVKDNVERTPATSSASAIFSTTLRETGGNTGNSSSFSTIDCDTGDNSGDPITAPVVAVTRGLDDSSNGFAGAVSTAYPTSPEFTSPPPEGSPSTKTDRTFGLVVSGATPNYSGVSSNDPGHDNHVIFAESMGLGIGRFPSTASTSSVENSEFEIHVPRYMNDRHFQNSQSPEADATPAKSTPADADALGPSTIAESEKRIAAGPLRGSFGQATWYNPGLGSCGETDLDSDLVVALATRFMSGGKNCNKRIKITDTKTGKSAVAKIRDTCPSCATGDLDMSPALFQKFQSLDIGRFDVKWNLE